MDIFSIMVVLLAGILAGAITGLVSASAVTIMVPLLILFLNMNPYIAIGLSLATDIIASSVAGVVYFKNKHVRLIPLLPFIFTTFAGITVGSYLSTFISSSNLSGVMGLATMGTGLVFLFNSSNHKNKSNFVEKLRLKLKNKMVFVLSVLGFIVGLNAGIFGAGGGITILLVAVFALNYHMHEAIGTSVVIMIMMAFLGGVSHFYFEPFSLIFLAIAGAGAFFGARYSSLIANAMSEEKLKKLAGLILTILGLLLTTKIFFW